MGIPSNLDTTLGFLLHAVVLCCILYGAGCLQGWYYFRQYRNKDSWHVQSLVYTILLLDTLQVAFLYASVYKYTVTSNFSPFFLYLGTDASLTDHGDNAFLGTLVPSLIIELIFSGLIALLVQHFYCYRIYRLSKSWILTGFVSLCSLGSFATLAYFIGVCLTQYTLLAELVLQDPISIATNVLGLVTDISISVILIITLHGSKTGFRKSTDLIIFAFNTGLPTTFCAILTVILLKAAPGTFIYIFIYVSMGRFYTNCLLVTLNSRDYIRYGTSQDTASQGYAMTVPSHIINQGRSEVRVDFQDQKAPTDETISIRVDKQTENFLNP